MESSPNASRANPPDPRGSGSQTPNEPAASTAELAAAAVSEPVRVRPRTRGQERQAIARHGRLKRHPWGTFGKVVASVAAVAVVSVLGIGAVAAVNLVSDAKPTVQLVGQDGSTSAPIPDIGAINGGVNILIAASDTRTGQGDAWGTTDDSSGAGLNDVTMLVHLSQNHKNAVVVSFPRDMMTAIPECPDGNGGWNSAMSFQPINTTLSDGGLACTVLTVEQITGLKIPFAALVDFNGVVAMSNAVGGVPVCIADGGIHDVHTDLDLPEGNVTLQGKEAAEFLRTRYGVGDGSDLGRISNTQVFLSSLVRTVLTPKTLTNPVKVWSLAKATLANVQPSDTLTLTTLYQMAMAAKDLTYDNIVFVQYPVGDDADYPGKVVADQESADALMSAVKDDQPIQLSGGTGVGAVAATDAPTPPPAADSNASTGSSGSGSSGGSGDTGSTTAPSSSAASTSVLPDDVKGQTAATQTCSKGNN
ncbi:LCP family protein [Humibacter soli]